LFRSDTVLLQADAQQDSRYPNLEVFLIGGVPLREPVVQYGPFVMSTQAEIMEAFEDFQKGRLGTVPAGALQPHRSGQ
ncbi:MAG: pirin-like C-terminal cupin domain-containing protein, partial [bacterium]|nr:pirin-like C-terminal cupin domain-containing protein [bacterium]